TPLLGICLGKQLLMEKSEEGESVEGLGLVKGKVIKFEKGKKIPHIGWNQIKIKKQVPILKNIPDGTFFYFVHSYYAVPDSPENVITATDYEGEFPSIVGRDNIYGIQFHPEKSQTYGLEILKNFAEL
ncbi:imidazole glycerol phosphate synthase subunit HisH, partial [candidate division KSB1 bacterium]